MTTTVRVLIEGNKACEVHVSEEVHGAQPSQRKTVSPGQFVTVLIHGTQQVIVQEVGDFL